MKIWKKNNHNTFFSILKLLFWSVFLTLLEIRQFFFVPIAVGTCLQYSRYNGIAVALACAQSLQLCPALCTPWTVAHQAPLAIGFSWQEYWSGLPCPPPGDLLNSRIEPRSSVSSSLQANSLPLSHQGNLMTLASDQFKAVDQSCPTLCDPMDCSTPCSPVHRQLPELVQTHVHWVGDAIQPSHPLLSPSPPAFSLSQHQRFF